MDTIRNISIILLCTVSVVNGENSRNCPKNAVVVEGNETISNCTFHPFNLTVFWKFKGIKQTQEESIYNGYRVLQNFTNRVSIMRPHNHSYDLKINDTRLDNAGTYICERGIGNPCSAELVVIAYHPKCSWNSTLSSEADGDIHIQCHVEYRGNMEATMQLEHDDAPHEGTKVSSNPHTWSWILKMKRTREKFHEIKCRLIFSSTIYSLDRSNNTAFVNWTVSIPLDQHIWSKDTTVKKAADKTKRNADDDTTAVSTTTLPSKNNNSFMENVVLAVCILVSSCSILTACIVTVYVAKSFRALERSCNRFDFQPASEFMAYSDVQSLPEKIDYAPFENDTQHTPETVLEVLVHQEWCGGEYYLGTNFQDDDIAAFTESAAMKSEHRIRELCDPCVEAVVHSTPHKTAASGDDAHQTNIGAIQQGRCAQVGSFQTGSALPIYSQVQKKDTRSGEHQHCEPRNQDTRTGMVNSGLTGSAVPIYAQIHKQRNDDESRDRNVTTTDIRGCYSHDESNSYPQTHIGCEDSDYMDWSSRRNETDNYVM